VRGGGYLIKRGVCCYWASWLCTMVCMAKNQRKKISGVKMKIGWGPVAYVVAGLVGLVLIVNSVQQPEVSEPVFRAAASIGGEEGAGIDREGGDWLERYCVERIGQVAVMPTVYERVRGPLVTFDPVERVGRFEGVAGVATCTLDYYYWPVVDEAFAGLEVEQRYSVAVWEKFAQVASASISGQLVSEGWEVVELDEEEAVRASLMLRNVVEGEDVVEYLDVFYEKNEEVVFELVVVSGR